MIAKLSIFFLLVCTLRAENFFMRPSGSGNYSGSDWGNSMRVSDISSSSKWGNGAGKISPGDSVYMSSGTYNGRMDLYGSGTPTSRIYIKRASSTDSACTSASGWQASFDGTVTILASGSKPEGLSCAFGAASYVTLDGLNFSVDHTSATGSDGCGLSIYYAGCTGFQFVNGSIYGRASSYTWDKTARGSQFGGAGGILNVDTLISNCVFYTISVPIFFGRNNGITIEYCTFYNITSFGGNDHGDNFYCNIESTGPSNVYIRYNYVYETGSEGWFFKNDFSSAACHIYNVHIYGNVFRNITGTGNKCISIDVGYSTGNGPFYINNNTFYYTSTPLASDSYPGVGHGFTLLATNNLFYNSGYIGFTHDYNWYSGTDIHGESHGISGGSVNPFVDANSYNFRIVSSSGSPYPRNSGATLKSIYSLDKDGGLRGLDGTWDIGAYEYGSPPPPPLTVASPSFDKDPGAYTNSVTITITCATAGSSIYYTLDGTTPTDSSIAYTSPITILTSSLISARAYKTGMTASDVASEYYEIVTSYEPPIGGNVRTDKMTIGNLNIYK